MALIHWQPVREIDSLQDEMNRLFGRFFENPQDTSSGPARRWLPAMDLVETGDNYVLRADLPGVGEDDVKIELEDSVLSISGERHAEREDQDEGFYRIERATGSFARSLTLPAGVDADRVEASFDRGVLEVRIPKPEARKPRRVAINLGDQPTAIEGKEAAQDR